MKILIDMNLSVQWVKLLSESGIESVHWSTVGAYNATDIEIINFALYHDYVILTHDLDFSAILAATGRDKPSVVQIRSDDIGQNAIGKLIVDSLKQMTSELKEGALLTINPKRTRMRVLPLRINKNK